MSQYFKFCKRCNADSERYADGRCKTCTLARHAEWAANNRDTRNASSRRWNAKNKDKKLQAAAEYRVKHRDHINARRKELRAANPNAERLKAAKRRAYKKRNGGVLSKNILEILLDKQQGRCACCGVLLNGVFHLDHKVPLSRGGQNSDDNVQLLLPVCNLRKYTLTQEEFEAKIKPLAFPPTA